jgi:putative transposase
MLKNFHRATHPPNSKIGVDLGVKVLATCSDGSSYDMPATKKKDESKLGKLQWRNRNKIIGNKKLGNTGIK